MIENSTFYAHSSFMFWKMVFDTCTDLHGYGWHRMLKREKRKYTKHRDFLKSELGFNTERLNDIFQSFMCKPLNRVANNFKTPGAMWAPN